ncbi:hypothetical protein DEO72_LG3g1995 [Vigna unguiculata]|uniref:Uncharacterized protein n=1 Tax=Vigna unguiculata TaxID=3917 RepID=A0A4D6LFM6_VIGUN|nr:hypothetical protein DEO72_LG3g1995 [Vigna unguiculata]
MPGGGHVPLGAASFQTAWRGTRAARRQAPHKSPFQQLPTGGTVSIARRTLLQRPRISSPSPGGTPLPPGASYTRTPLLSLYRLADLTLSPGAYLCSTGFGQLLFASCPHTHPQSIILLAQGMVLFT